MSGGIILQPADSGKADVVLTTKGDLATWTTERSTLSGTGSILYSSGANALAQLSAGTGEYTLKMNSGGTAPEWVDVSAGGTNISTQEISPTADQTTTSGSTAVTNGSATLANRTGGVVLATYFQVANSTVADQIVCKLYYNGSVQKSVNSRLATTGQMQIITISTTDDLDGGTFSLYWGTGGGTATLANVVSNMSRCVLFEVS